jgi:methylated-DNA-[protein]-cysteine S-methyltransferase
MEEDRYQFRLPSPLGEMTALAGPRGLQGLWFDGQKHHPGPLQAARDDAHPLRERLAGVLDAYFAGRGLVTVELPLDPQGTAFQRSVWQALRAIPDGASRRYGELAQLLGRPLAARAVGAAVGRNPISLLIPCHRVLGTAGQLTGYAGGLPRKIALLTLEGAAFAKAA